MKLIKNNKKNMKEQMLIAMQGIPGSGKSFRARQLLADLQEEKDMHAIIVNRDDIRDMLGDYWVPTREGLVTKLEMTAIKEGLKGGYHVIVDATNLNPKTILTLERLATKESVEFKFEAIKVTPIQAYIAILWRYITGGRYISYKKIEGFYGRYKNIIG